MPPQQRSKSRYFNLDELLKWGIKIIKYLETALQEAETKENNRKRLESKLEWVKEYQDSLIMWQEMISITINIESKIKKEGLSKKLYQEFEQNCQPGLETETIK